MQPDRNADAEEKEAGSRFHPQITARTKVTPSTLRPQLPILTILAAAQAVSMGTLCNAVQTLGAKSQLHGGGLQAYLRLATSSQPTDKNHSVYRYFYPGVDHQPQRNLSLTIHTRPLRHLHRPEVTTSAAIGRRARDFRRKQAPPLVVWWPRLPGYPMMGSAEGPDGLDALWAWP